MVAVVNAYSFKNVKTIYGGIEIIGFGQEADDHVVVTAMQDVVTKTVGSDGKNVIYNVSADQTGEITIKLLANSVSNLFLSEQFNLLQNDLIINDLPFALLDVNGFATVSATHAIPTAMPILTEGTTSQIREWKLLCSNIRIVIGPL